MKRFFCKNFVFLLILIPTLVKADTCSYSELSKAKSLATNVSTAYEIKSTDDGKQYIRIGIYNIDVDLSIQYSTNKSSNEVNNFIYYSDTDNGTYYIEDYDIDNIYTYTIYVYDANYGCTSKLRKILVKKPKRNEIYDSDECKNEAVSSDYYCNEWITQEFGYSKSTILTKIQKKIDEYETEHTTKTDNSEKPIELTFKDKIKLLDKKSQQMIIGILAGMLFDLILIIILIIRIIKERNEF